MYIGTIFLGLWVRILAFLSKKEEISLQSCIEKGANLTALPQVSVVRKILDTSDNHFKIALNNCNTLITPCNLNVFLIFNIRQALAKCDMLGLKVYSLFYV